ncbi:hypothetical protein T459_16836 [Capsicum annuum]|uniref:Ubiquitin-like protease family profile domain-containing protein n=1 Tax=Capsicum annuum TaxID=4072 RepID=A0A2G2ZA09_CAPAN|nr:hypothetical protein T459_16836 [Capsicum annuum]
MRYISHEHYVGQYIRGFKTLVNVSWDTVDNIIIPVNINESFHWIMILFRIRHRESAYIDKSMIDPLKYVIVRNIPQQAPQSNDCGMYACAFAEFISHELFDISINMFNATNHRIRYGALLWDYAKKK